MYKPFHLIVVTTAFTNKVEVLNHREMSSDVSARSLLIILNPHIGVEGFRPNREFEIVYTEVLYMYNTVQKLDDGLKSCTH